MASHGNSKGSVKSSTIDKMDVTADEETEQKKLPIVSSVEQHNGLNDAVNDAEEKKNLTSDATNEHARVQEKNADDIENENKPNTKSLITDKNEQKDKTEKNQEAQDNLHEDSQNTDEKKDMKDENNKDTATKTASLKRKRKSLSASSTTESSVEENGTRSKRKKLKSTYDRFCWRCHKEGVDAHCTACPRSWHRKCIGGMPPSVEKWICGECVTILRAENAETRSPAMTQVSVDQLCMLLKHVVERLRDYPGSEPFCKPVDLTEVPNYLDYVIKPMDLSLLETNVRSKLYGSTDAFMADAKWIQHNCIVFNTCGGVYADTSKLTNAAKQIIKVARQEVSEIEACPDCYSHGRNLPRPQPSWFIEPCRRPHPLVWAKLKGFPFWPAKAMPRVNSQGHVDVRFFGEHDRAWVPPKDLYLYSEEPPAPSPRKRKSDMDECVREITRHCRKLALMFGHFKFAPPKVQYNPNDPMQIQLMLPNYNPLEPYNPFPNPESVPIPKKKMPLRKRNSPFKGKSQIGETDDGEVDANSKKNMNDGNHEKDSQTTTPKVQKLDTDDIKDTSKSQTNVDGNNSKLSKKADQGIVTVAQNKTIKDEKSKHSKTLTPRVNVPITDNVTGNNSTISNINITSQNNSQKMNETAKLPMENLSKPATSPFSKPSDTMRTQKRTLLKNIINPKPMLSQMEDTSKATVRHTKNTKVYKPKTRIVDKLNAEKAKSISASKENEKLILPNSSGVIQRVSLLNNKEISSTQNIPEIDITVSPPLTPSSTKVTSTISSTNSLAPVADKSVLLFVVNNGKDGTTKDVHHNPIPKKESKARKSFPNRSRNPSNIQHTLPDAGQSVQVSLTKGETTSTYQLLPPEAGPISARLHQNANELAKRMGQLMEEAYKEAALINANGENGTADNYEASIFFLRMQIEHMKWQHQQQLAELKHNTDRTMREMRMSMEAEKLRSVEEARREAEEEKCRCIEETKRKQWCANCGQEAMFYCCWNTAYCDYPCQQSHWPTHMRTCSQQAAISQQSNKTMTNDSTGRVYSLPPSKLTGIPPS